MSICDFLFSADMCVASTSDALDRLQAVLDLPQPSPRAYVRYEDEGWDVIFALVNKNFAAGPTRLEIIAPLDKAGVQNTRNGRRVYDRQAPRLWRTHATVVATPDMAGLVERVRSAGARHWFQEATPDVPFERLWMGAAEGDLGDYDPAADAGFVFEFIPSTSSAFAPQLFKRPHDKPQPGDTGLRRIASRSFLVRDLDETLRRLETVFGWTPAHAVREEPSRGYRYVEMSANYGHGAALKVLQATSTETPVGRDYAAQGPGPYAITVTAFDLEAFADALTERGAPSRPIDAGKWEPRAIVAGAALGAPIVVTPDRI